MWVWKPLNKSFEEKLAEIEEREKQLKQEEVCQIEEEE